MSGIFVFITLSALLGVLTAFEGIWAFVFFLLYLFGLWTIKKIPVNGILLCTVCFITYFLIGDFTLLHNKTTISPINPQFQVQFTDEVKIDGNHLKAVVIDTSTREKLLLTYKIPSEFEKNQLQNQSLLKKSCSVNGNLITPTKARNQNGFNYQAYLQRNQIFWILDAKELGMGTCINKKLTILDEIKLFRSKGISRIEKNFTKETAPLAAALIFGSRELIEEETLTAYQRIGIIHLIAISGLHVSLLVGMIFYIGIRLGVVRETLTKMLMISLPLYSVLTGASPSVNRAVIMTMIILGIKNIRLPTKLSSISGLCISFLLLVLINPLTIYHVGFQLSFVVTFSLLLSFTIIEQYSFFVSKMAVTSYISTVVALPFLLYHFFETPLLSILANLIFIPLYSFIFLPGLIFLFIIQFISMDLFDVLSLLFSVVIEKSNQLANLISSVSWSRAIPGRPSFLFLILYTVCIFLSFFYWENRRRRLVLTLPWLVLCLQLLLPSPYGEVTFIDVGQGDSIFINLPFNQGNYLIDTGGNLLFQEEIWKQKKNKYDVGHDVIVPFLKSKGIAKLDLLILTHGDMDHIGGSLSILKNIEVKRILFPSYTGEKSKVELEIMQIAKQKKMMISYLSEGAAWKEKNSEFLVISPTKGYSGEKNDGSIVLYARVGGIFWLFTGDLGKEGESEILKKYPNLVVDVLKVGHHGSRNSSSAEFIQHLKPKYSIISAGEKNSFGHPHSEVLKILEAEGSEILRTDQQGGITYIFKGNSGTFLK